LYVAGLIAKKIDAYWSIAEQILSLDNAFTIWYVQRHSIPQTIKGAIKAQLLRGEIGRLQRHLIAIGFHGV